MAVLAATFCLLSYKMAHGGQRGCRSSPACNASDACPETIQVQRLPRPRLLTALFFRIQRCRFAQAGVAGVARLSPGSEGRVMVRSRHELPAVPVPRMCFASSKYSECLADEDRSGPGPSIRYPSRFALECSFSVSGCVLPLAICPARVMQPSSSKPFGPTPKRPPVASSVVLQCTSAVTEGCRAYRASPSLPRSTDIWLVVCIASALCARGPPRHRSRALQPAGLPASHALDARLPRPRPHAGLPESISQLLKDGPRGQQFG